MIMTDASYGDGCCKIIGMLEISVRSKLIGPVPLKEGEMRMFYLRFKEIRDKLPTATNTVFSY